MAQTFTETVGMLNLVIGHLDNAGNAAALTAKGLDVAATKTRLTTEKNNIVTLDAQQEALKVALPEKTKELETAPAARLRNGADPKGRAGPARLMRRQRRGSQVGSTLRGNA